MGVRHWRQAWKDLRGRVRAQRWVDLNSRERQLRFLLDIGRLAILRLRRNRAGMMAAALSYRVLFSILPLLVLAAAIAKRSISEKTFLQAVHDGIDRLSLRHVKVPGQSDGSSTIDLGRWLEGLAAQAAQYDFTGVTWIGLVVLMWAVWRLFDEIEASLSVIGSGVRRQKAWIRMVVSLILLVLGPALVTWGLTALNDVAVTIQATGLGILAQVGQVILTLFAVWIFVLLAYRFIPAGRVGWRSAAVGAAFAALALLVGEWVLRKLTVGAVQTSPIGGSFGLVPALMLWVYIMWICVLYGMEVAVLLHRARRRWAQIAGKPVH